MTEFVRSAFFLVWALSLSRALQIRIWLHLFKVISNLVIALLAIQPETWHNIRIPELCFLLTPLPLFHTSVCLLWCFQFFQMPQVDLRSVCKISLWFGSHNIERANSITLPVCHVEGFPLPSITWTKMQADIMPAKAVVKGKQLKHNKYQDERFGFVVQMSSLKQLRKWRRCHTALSTYVLNQYGEIDFMITKNWRILGILLRECHRKNLWLRQA